MENGFFIGQDYFEHLLAEIREIRLSERRFYQKLTDIYSTAIDYSSDAATTKLFFKKNQNKIHYAEWDRVEQFSKELVKYIRYYNNDRIKLRLKYKSPVQYRALFQSKSAS